ncbi:MAG: FadR/GntR family transcriptional regulator [Microbacteriaceae bacterium]
MTSSSHHDRPLADLVGDAVVAGDESGLLTEQAGLGLATTNLLLTPIRGGNAFEECVERLLQTIRLGLAQPGEQLPPERELAVMLEVSRDTVRDAISSLADAGYLVVKRGRYGGTFIADTIPAGPVVLGRDGELLARPHFTTDEILDVLVYRDVVEAGAAYHAATRELSGESREMLWAAHTETNEAGEEDYRRLDSRLHLLIAELSGSATLVNGVAQSRMRVNELLNEFPLLSPNIAHSNAQHAEIVMAILTGNATAAADAMRAHVSGSASLIRGFLA